ncbi:tight adherence protein B [Arthrobacter sp. PL16]|nr:tight adherence protein B [Arthrobacter sp. PL16]
MTGLTVAFLLVCASAVLALPRTTPAGSIGFAPVLRRPARTGPPGGRPSTATRSRRWTRRMPRGALGVYELPLFVHQLAGLLRAGRPPFVLWADMERIYADGNSDFAVAALPVISTARRAAELGLSIPHALRMATGPSSGRADGRGATTHMDRLWVDLAGCLIVAERSGAPLAGILEQYAAQLDADLDGLSAQETVLAGPRATVVLLAWLPGVGLILGFALGVDPPEVLFGSPLGRLTLATGVLLMITSRLWSRRLVRRAGAVP